MSIFADDLRALFSDLSATKDVLRAHLLLFGDVRGTSRNSDGETPLMVAISTCNQLAAEVLIESGHQDTDDDYTYAMMRYPCLKHFIAEHL